MFGTALEPAKLKRRLLWRQSRPRSGNREDKVRLRQTLDDFLEFLADARARADKINFASAGVGSGTHLNLEKLKLDANINDAVFAAEAVEMMLGLIQQRQR